MIQLSELIAQLRRELADAVAEGDGKPLRFDIGSVELEATLTVDREATADGRVRFWVVETGGAARAAHGETQRVTLTLQPRVLGPDGAYDRALIGGDSVDGER
ncbi:trypco2 family protein [Streptomyces avicenniae]|uniref:trypco2 family protein n=1 Tax=Streptomyces avicenniae TaxID=500153 RepID=UPI0006995540|nr:trypco2 family protein [Streptomyces avicenniae]